MDRKEAAKLLPIIKAFSEGKTLQIRQNGSKWIDIETASFTGFPSEYRIKPESTYRPFANAKECWAEMEKHQPFGWVKDKKDGYYILITAVDNGDYMSLSGNSGWSFYSLMKDYTFADDIPFGIKKEEE